MNTATKGRKRQAILFTIVLRNKVTGDTIRVLVCKPSKHKHFSKKKRVLTQDLRSEIVVSHRNQQKRETIAAGSVMGIFWMTSEYIRHRIVAGHENDWVDENDVPIWVLIPRTIPISWGYDFYKHIVDLVDGETEKFTDEINERRQAYEAKRRGGN